MAARGIAMSFVGAVGRRLAAGLLVLLTTATILVGVAVGPAQADILTDRILAPNSGEMVFNSTTDDVYVAQWMGTTVTKVNVRTKVAKTIPVAGYPEDMAVNEKPTRSTSPTRALG